VDAEAVQCFRASSPLRRRYALVDYFGVRFITPNARTETPQHAVRRRTPGMRASSGDEAEVVLRARTLLGLRPTRTARQSYPRPQCDRDPLALMIMKPALSSVLVLAFLGCDKHAPLAAPDVASPTPVASASGSAVETVDAALSSAAIAQAVVKDWNDAVNAKDATALKRLYDTTVSYYGTTLRGDACVARIMAALAKDPGYHQEISGARTSGNDLVMDVAFKKTFGKTTVDAYIAVDPRKRVIVLESDKTTDANLAKAKTCLTYGPVTLQDGIGHAVAPNEEFWTTEKAYCVVKGEFDDPSAPPRLDDVYLQVMSDALPKLPSSPKGYVIKGFLQPGGTHQDATIVADSITPRQ
jgi:hypothetical protein